MWIDITIIIILLLCLVQGYRKGLVKTILNTLGWVISMACAFFFSDKLVELLEENTTWFITLENIIEKNLSDHGIHAISDILGQFPSIVQEYVSMGVDTISSSLAGALTAMTFKICSFLLIVLAVRLLFWTIEALFSKENTGGVIGTIDGLSGAIVGLVEAVIIAYIFLMVLIPLSTALDNQFIANSLESSFAAKYLYDYNLILVAIRGFFQG